ncbi:MAG: ABC-type multidrug transport system, ATPase and permease component [Amycolatopsis sp.]|jgi:ABC-type multidrug transport system fused ATPase/permease subunit|uniref:ABC transporter transmembrane domain-containing protein n=1 Tax=Amycolatopsis sp. TaxID=37632 RepID=UPI00262FD961|nr:ABC transporter ATP-binding protein [Amycolatopsis sp.]MCU1686362.1 ABC-type multidrug transport system, ATPase and permease component [Amycolatopsis sp.]
MGLTVPPADPGTPDLRGAVRYLFWLVKAQAPRVWRGVLLGSLWMVGLMLAPLVLSHAIDDGMRARNLTALCWWSGGLVAQGVLVAVLGMARHRTMTFIRIDASIRTARLVVRHATRLGSTLPREISAGEVVSIGAADLATISQAMTITGPGVGAVVAYTVVTVLLLRISVLLAVVTVVGVPLLAVLLGPLLNRLLHVETGYRDLQGVVTARAGDLVTGLRVLCGIGGKDLFAQRYRADSQAMKALGYRVGAVSSWIEALSVGLPGLFLAAVTWLAARMAASGQITIGEMVAVYGYVAALVVPVAFFIEGSDQVGRGVVAARRVVRILTLEPAFPPGGDGVPGPCGQAELRDPRSGLLVAPGGLTVLAATRPEDAVRLFDRLGRYEETDVTWGGIPVAEMAVDEVRRRILVADNDAHLFAGSLREMVGGQRGNAVVAAMETAAALDITDGLPLGLNSFVDDQARTLSGGQRQRLRLARAVLADPDVLLLNEPTSAVDTHTEARIAARLHEARRGRTTVVASTSPLLLDQADHVAYLRDGQVVATGCHADLLTTVPDYRNLVFRGAEEEATR